MLSQPWKSFPKFEDIFPDAGAPAAKARQSPAEMMHAMRQWSVVGARRARAAEAAAAANPPKPATPD